MSQIILAPDQREHLLAQLDRRLRKLSDSALIELERLTRYPNRLPGFVPRQAIVLETEPPAWAIQSPRHPSEHVGAPDRRPVSRRELLAYVAGGGMALLAGVTGYAWSSTQNRFTTLSTLFDQMDACDLDRIVSEAMRDLGGQIDELKDLTETTNQKANSSDAALGEYQVQFSSLQESVAQLEEVITKMRERWDHLENMGEASATVWLDVISQVLQTIQDLQIFPIRENLPVAWDVMSQILKNIPSAVATAESVLADLRTWFSTEQGQAIDTRLFQPLRDKVIKGVNEIATQASSLEETWEQNLVQPAEQAIQERSHLRMELASLE